MMLANRPILTDEFADAADFRPEPSAIFVYGMRAEARTHHLDTWRSAAINLRLIKVTEDDVDAVRTGDDPERRLMLRDVGDLRLLLGGDTSRPLYLDITGLSNHVWPALLKVAQGAGFRVRVIYVEPSDYSYSASPRENVFFDLSELIRGISPIPQFSNLYEPAEDEVALIPLLGFEGARLAHLLEDVQPTHGSVSPVVGVPGFRAEYPFYTYQGNQIALKNSDAWQNIRFAKANCPFSLYYCIQDIVDDYGDDRFFKIGLIGTKPHALGAVLFSLHAPDRVELIYDHNLRKPDRTSGKKRLLVYPVTDFLVHMMGTLPRSCKT